jgi:uncharacterized protein with HEPN domain
MKNRDDSVYIKHILDAIGRIREYTHGVKYEDFIDSPLIQDGVIRQIEIIGEASKKLSIDLRQLHSDIPWKDIAEMRDKLIHNYLGVDIDAVWDTIIKDIPVLEGKLKDI